MYDGVREFHVQTRESGTRSEKQTESELRSRSVNLLDVCVGKTFSHRGPPT